eukprot:scaffold20854_cov147-Skeletonema_marinoi.AAC.1
MNGGRPSRRRSSVTSMPRERSVHPRPHPMDDSEWSIDDIRHRVGRGNMDEDCLDFVHASDDIIQELFVTDSIIKKLYNNNPTNVCAAPTRYCLSLSCAGKSGR